MSRGFQSRHDGIRKAANAFSNWTRFRSDIRSAFGDMVHVWAISLLNSFMPRDDAWAAREAEFEAIKARIGEDGIKIYAECLGALSMASAEARGDHLGEMFQQISAGSKALGQFFTPYHVSEMMALMTMSADVVSQTLEQNGHVSAMEPACGAGGMVVAMGAAMEQLGHDPLWTLRVHAIDIDRIAVDMTFVQSTLQRVPCYVEQANALNPNSGDSISYRFPNIHYANAVGRDTQAA